MAKIIPGVNDAVTLCPELEAFWSEDNERDPHTIGKTDKREAKFKCPEKGHEFSISVFSFAANPVCRVCKREANSLLAAKPHIKDWWDYDKNGDKRPEQFRPNSPEVVGWKCPKCGYTWESEIATRFSSKDQCPCCDLGIAFKKGVNDAETKCPEIRRHWDEEKNALGPDEYFISSKESVHWRCDVCGFSWTSSLIGHINYDSETKTYSLKLCRACYGKALAPGEKGFVQEYPELAAEYIPELNTIDINTLTSKSGQELTWKCKTCNQIFDARVYSRVNSINGPEKQTGCPYCEHKKPIPGVNDFETWCKQNDKEILLREWDTEANQCTPADCYCKSGKFFSWICTNNPEHKWTASILDRTKGFWKCPECRDKKPSQKLDVGRPELLKHWDYKQNKHKPSRYNTFSNDLVYWNCDEGHSYQHPIYRYSQKGFYCPICESTKLFPGVNDLETLYPELAAEWSELNDTKPSEHRTNSAKDFYWNCPNGHPPYQRSIGERTSNPDAQCPVCMKSKVVPGVNDVLSEYPKIEEIWDYEGNSGKTPDSFLSATLGRKFDFVCKEKGHHWNETLFAVVNNDYTCAYCTNRMVLEGYNSLRVLHPELAEEWDYESPNNIGFTPDTITVTRAQKFGWICGKCDNKFNLSVRDRLDGVECPFCDERMFDPTMHSLQARYPELAQEYSSENEVPADGILAPSYHMVKWDCPVCGGTWPARIRDRVSGEAKCPFCDHRKIRAGVYSLKALYPEIAAKLDTSDGTDPDNISPKGSNWVYWNCDECNMRWGSTIKDRTEGNAKCPYCEGKYPIPGVTSFKALYPKIAEEFSKENHRDPDTFFPNVATNAQWDCKECGQSWHARIVDRVEGVVKCPYCDNKRAIPGKTSFKALHSEIAKEFSDENGRDPDQLLPSATFTVKWNCDKCKQTWTGSVAGRVDGTETCPYCDGRRAIPGKTSFKALYPEIAKEFSDENGRDPDLLLPSATLFAKWNCDKCKQSWQGRVVDRTEGTDDCPYCNGRRAIPGKTSLKALYSEIAKEFSDENGRDPDQLLPSATFTVKWNCNKCKQTWTGSVAGRVDGTETCPYCDGRRVIPGETSLKALHPDIAKEFSDENGRDPDTLFPDAHYWAKWNCDKCKQSWHGFVSGRIKGNETCPYCDGRRVIPGKTSFKALYPEIAKEFSDENGRGPDQLLPSATFTVKWNCNKCKQTWTGSVAGRVDGTETCPYCAGRRVIPGETSLKALHPDIAKEFSDENGRDPDQLLPSATLFAKWNCDKCKQSWQGRVVDRTEGTDDCPYCNGRRAIPGKTSFGAMYPALRNEWDEIANFLIDPETLLPSYSVPVWWKCSTCGENYSLSVRERVRDFLGNRTSCSHCKGYRRLKHYIV